jgi:hypothetical protein
MKVTLIDTTDAMGAALENLAEAGIDFEVVCSGPERFCSHLAAPAAA